MFFLHQEFAIILYLCLNLRGYFCLLLFCICVLMFVGEGSLVPAYMRLLILALSAQRSSLLNIIITNITLKIIIITMMRKDDLSRNWSGFFCIFIWFIFYEVYLWSWSAFFYIFIWFIHLWIFFMKLKLILFIFSYDLFL